jgi:prevent-host-death family protein
MERIGVRALRQNASRYRAHVAERREPIEITDHGRPVARLVPVIGDDRANLIAAAEVTPAVPTIDIRDTEPLTATESARQPRSRQGS